MYNYRFLIGFALKHIEITVTKKLINIIVYTLIKRGIKILTFSQNYNILISIRI